MYIPLTIPVLFRIELFSRHRHLLLHKTLDQVKSAITPMVLPKSPHLTDLIPLHISDMRRWHRMSGLFKAMCVFRAYGWQSVTNHIITFLYYDSALFRDVFSLKFFLHHHTWFSSLSTAIITRPATCRLTRRDYNEVGNTRPWRTPMILSETRDVV